MKSIGAIARGREVDVFIQRAWEIFSQPPPPPISRYI